MSKQLEFLAREAVRGRLSRREFLGRAAALGLTPPLATKLLTSTALAQGPQMGGDLRRRPGRRRIRPTPSTRRSS